MNRLLVIGAGGHGRVVADAALSMQSWGTIAFIDDRPVDAGSPLGLTVAGTTAALASLVREYPCAVIALGESRDRMRLLEICRRLGYELPLIVHRSASVSRYATMGAGCVVFAQAAVNPGARLGDGCIVNTGASVDHDCELGAGVHVCPGARLAGKVRVGDRTWIGIGACVRQGIEIGSDVTIGAGGVVVADVASNLTVMGVPARERCRS